MDDDQLEPEKTKQRLEKLLQGAFSGAPTPLKDIPKQIGKARVARSKKLKSKATAPA